VGANEARRGAPNSFQRITGYILGGVSPLGQKKALRTVIDETARTLERIYVSGGRRGLDISLPPADLAELTRAGYAAIGR
ncbi:MAG: Cys-tRNA(Pro) deacylase, partial [Gammaproteobacteria bacterium]|nr:Cys-tRNA(Pro) deacylase [Gammaproteobacteria bacterium]